MISRDSILDLQAGDFEDAALEVFDHQLSSVPLYRDFVSHWRGPQFKPQTWLDIPCLPIAAFRNHQVVATGALGHVFRSSGTTGSQRSRHQVDLEWYTEVVLAGFKRVYGDPRNWIICGLAPGYELNDSSLVAMIRILSRRAERPGMITLDPAEMQAFLTQCDAPVWLIGVTHGLMALSKLGGSLPKGSVVVETGGMKGHGKELLRSEVHEQLKAGLCPVVHSEYGMTELCSQAWSTNGGLFETPPWMRASRRDLYDPLQPHDETGTGAINVMDLANWDSCAFVATDDLGRWTPQGFEVLGRVDQAEIRGCNLLFPS